MKVCGSGGLDPYILNHGSGRQREMSLIILPFLHSKKVTHIQK